MTVEQLIRTHNANHPNSHFFDRDTLRFFGERISEMRVLKGTYKVRDGAGNEYEAYCLSSRQRKHPCGPRRHYSYFEVGTFKYIYCV